VLWGAGHVPLGVFLWTTPRDLDWSARCVVQAQRLDELLQRMPISKVVCELPQHFEGARGQAAEGRGDIIKLTYMVGGYGIVCGMRGISFEHAPVMTWKGQLSKESVEKRVRRIIGEDHFERLRIRRDVIDACGIGLWARGLF